MNPAPDQLTPPQPPEKLRSDSEGSFLQKYPSFRFTSCIYEKCERDDVKDILALFKKMEQRKWGEVFQCGGLNYEKLHKGGRIMDKIGSCLPSDAVPESIRLGDKPRMYGYRVDAIFYVVYYDRNHKYT